MKKTGKIQKNMIAPLAVAAVTLLALVLYTFLFLNHLMHSDMAAEVLLSKLLADRGEIITREWFYSTEIRILYTQLVMTPLFHLFSDFHTVKVLSILIYLALLLWAFFFFARRIRMSWTGRMVALMLLLAPWSNEYLDMMFLGDFYTSQVICMFLFLSLFFGEQSGKKPLRIFVSVFMAVFSVLCGLSGLRYPACLFIPLLLSPLAELVTAKKDVHMEGIRDHSLLRPFMTAFLASVFAGMGFLVHRFYLTPNYSFDKTPVEFLPLSEIPERALTSIRLMLELFGYRDGVSLASGLGIVNVLKCFFFIIFVVSIADLFRKRNELLDEKERLLLWYFIFLFLINLYTLVFTGVLLQYRYWIPVYAVGVFMVSLWLDRAVFANNLQKDLIIAFFCIAALSCLYSEMWQDVKFNDCAKREGYMSFLSGSDYDFGYATFWNGPVTEYLSNGRIHVGNIGDDGPYEWLTPKAYYRKGYHKGKVFVLLATTEERGLLESDAPIMHDAEKVYGDEFYSIYERDGMFLFSEQQ